MKTRKIELFKPNYELTTTEEGGVFVTEQTGEAIDDYEMLYCQFHTDDARLYEPETLNQWIGHFRARKRNNPYEVALMPGDDGYMGIEITYKGWRAEFIYKDVMCGKAKWSTVSPIVFCKGNMEYAPYPCESSRSIARILNEMDKVSA